MENEGEERFYAPRNPEHVSHSITNLQRTVDYFMGPVKTLGTVMREPGHGHIDLLKLDIEGAEYAVLRQGLASGLRPGIICVELEAPSPWPNLSILWQLRRRGYRLLKVDGRNLTLIHHKLFSQTEWDP